MKSMPRHTEHGARQKHQVTKALGGRSPYLLQDPGMGLWATDKGRRHCTKHLPK